MQARLIPDNLPNAVIVVAHERAAHATVNRGDAFVRRDLRPAREQFNRGALACGEESFQLCRACSAA